ncbi:putative PC-Esterase, trichome birefringence-like family [Helianthus annuus]|nr:putative PC-Esterase, trichome birefringence-like family [Helianthus annuus]
MNVTDFLERLRGKRMVFVGDSLNRNMWESLVCILRHSLKNKKILANIPLQYSFIPLPYYCRDIFSLDKDPNYLFPLLRTCHFVFILLACTSFIINQ